MRRPRVSILVVWAVATLLVSGCTGGGKATGIDITVREFGFSPGDVQMKSGQRYELHVKNNGQLLHDWTIDSMPASGITVGESGHHDMTTMSIGTPAPGMTMLHMAAEHGTTAMMSFTPTKAGTYSFYCTVEGHRAAGMEGRLIVE